VLPLRGEKPKNRPVSKNNTIRADRAALRPAALMVLFLLTGRFFGASNPGGKYLACYQKPAGNQFSLYRVPK